jgi:hypothetical protein
MPIHVRKIGELVGSNPAVHLQKKKDRKQAVGAHVQRKLRTIIRSMFSTSI